MFLVYKKNSQHSNSGFAKKQAQAAVSLLRQSLLAQRGPDVQLQTVDRLVRNIINNSYRSESELNANNQIKVFDPMTMEMDYALASFMSRCKEYCKENGSKQIPVYVIGQF